MKPTASAAISRSRRLATVSPTMPSPRKIETPSGSQVPNGGASCDSGSPSRRPIRSPSRRPTTAVTNSAVDSASTCRISHVAGTTVRYGRIANPSTIQATTHAASRAPAYSLSRKSPSPEAASASPTTLPSAAPRRRM